MKTKNAPTSRFWTWFDSNFLALFSGLLLVFIPLYPKIPLFDAIPGYIVRVRIEDFMVLLAALFWFIQVLRRRVQLHPLLTKLIGLYVIIGFLSTLSAIFITQTVPLSSIHVAKLYLHYFRRIEYLSLFFILYTAVRTKVQAKVMIWLTSIIMIAVALYGFGQKYFYWPVFSTMNREFAKGWVLYLTEHARVPSTFGGHYDAAAFTVVVITIALALFFSAKYLWQRLITLLAFLSGFWLLILTASRTSFIAYLGSVTLLMGLFVITGTKWYWVLAKWAGVMAFSLAVMLSFGDLSARFSQVLGLDKFRDKFQVAFLMPKVEKPQNGTAVDEISAVTTPSDMPPSTEKPGSSSGGGATELPGDVYENIPIPIPVVDEAGNYTGTYKEVQRTYSDNAYKYGLSAAIRFDALWPRAIAGFEKNVLLGSGYSTLTKEGVSQFTEAESTDNDFLRNLGETGALGFLSFYGCIAAVAFLSLKNALSIKDKIFKAYLIGFAAATVGLLLNAVYIDVYESSKVAEVYWALAGLALVIPQLASPKVHAKNTPLSAR